MADFAIDESIDETTDIKLKLKQSGSSHCVKKRLPPRLPRKKNELYVNNKTPLKVLLANCEKLLEEEPEIIIHGLGAAVASAINVALQLKERYADTLQIAVNTSSVELIDDLQPEFDAAEAETQMRVNSAVHICIGHVTRQV